MNSADILNALAKEEISDTSSVRLESQDLNIFPPTRNLDVPEPYRPVLYLFLYR